MPERRPSWRCAALVVALALSGSLTGGAVAQEFAGEPLVEGVVWQPDALHKNPKGTWDRLGVSNLLVQWTAVDDATFVSGARPSAVVHAPDWSRIAAEPWARNVIVGLAGAFDETWARAHVEELAERSRHLVSARPPVNVEGWYFPVEVDPTWKDMARLKRALDRLPRPLWISVYDHSELGAKGFADWVARWLPADVGVFWQDGCGAFKRDPATARAYADALAGRFGTERVRVIAEAFRPKRRGGFRPATAYELAPQLARYQGFKVYLFDGPHYVSPTLVDGLLKHPLRSTPGLALEAPQPPAKIGSGQDS